MSRGPKVILPALVGLLTALTVSPRLAGAQSLGAESAWEVLDVTKALNGAIDENKDNADLRERTVRRLAECALIYGGLSTLTSNAETKKSYVQAQLATSDVEGTISKPLQPQKRIELEEAARKSVALKLDAIKWQRDQEIGPLLKSCKALNDVNEIKNALRQLPPMQADTAAPGSR
jgi:hypothetical protein